MKDYTKNLRPRVVSLNFRYKHLFSFPWEEEIQLTYVNIISIVSCYSYYVFISPLQTRNEVST